MLSVRHIQSSVAQKNKKKKNIQDTVQDDVKFRITFRLIHQGAFQKQKPAKDTISIIAEIIYSEGTVWSKLYIVQAKKMQDTGLKKILV